MLADYVERARPFEPIIMQFISQWMSLRERYRRELAANGAVRCHFPGHPIHYVCPVLGNTFDAGNRIYELTLKTICPSIVHCGYNRNSLGNICEAFLATGMRSSSPSARSLAMIIERTAGAMYTVCYAYNLYTLEDIDAKYEEITGTYRLTTAEDPWLDPWNILYVD